MRQRKLFLLFLYLRFFGVYEWNPFSICLQELILDKKGHPWKLMWEIKPSEIIKAIWLKRIVLLVSYWGLTSDYLLWLLRTGFFHRDECSVCFLLAFRLKRISCLVGVGGRSPISLLSQGLAFMTILNLNLHDEVCNKMTVSIGQANCDVQFRLMGFIIHRRMAISKILYFTDMYRYWDFK